MRNDPLGVSRTTIAVGLLLLLLASSTAYALAQEPNPRSVKLTRTNARDPPPPVYMGNETSALASSTPHVAGFMTGNYFYVDAVQARCSFPNTNPGVIQSNNRLLCGIFETVFSSKNSLDYGYRMYLWLESSGNLVLYGDAWWFCEGLPGSQCGGYASHPLYNTGAWIVSGPSLSDPITVRMSFDTPTKVAWYFSVWGGPFGKIGEFAVPPESLSGFIVGTLLWNLVRWVKYFQFGLESDYNIGHGGWNVYVDYPQYFKNGAWNNVPQAKAVQGPNAFLDAMWVWGGAGYGLVQAYYRYNSQIGPYKVHFYYSGSTTLPDGTVLWG